MTELIRKRNVKEKKISRQTRPLSIQNPSGGRGGFLFKITNNSGLGWISFHRSFNLKNLNLLLSFHKRTRRGRSWTKRIGKVILNQTKWDWNACVKPIPFSLILMDRIPFFKKEKYDLLFYVITVFFLMFFLCEPIELSLSYLRKYQKEQKPVYGFQDPPVARWYLDHVEKG